MDFPLNVPVTIDYATEDGPIVGGATAGDNDYVADSGSGFDADRIKSGLGLVSMEERVRLLGGSFRISSQPRLGTRLEVRVPLSESTTNLASSSVRKRRA